MVDRCLEPEVGEGPDQLAGVPVRSEDVVVAARVAIAEFGDGVHIGAVVAVECGIAVTQPVGAGAAGGEVEVSAAVRLLEVGVSRAIVARWDAANSVMEVVT